MSDDIRGPVSFVKTWGNIVHVCRRGLAFAGALGWLAVGGLVGWRLWILAASSDADLMPYLSCDVSVTEMRSACLAALVFAVLITTSAVERLCQWLQSTRTLENGNRSRQ
jgi:hypothetical protein